MAKRIRHAPLNVFVNERQVGQLNRESTGAIRFQYDADWLAWEHASPVSISLPLREDQFVGCLLYTSPSPRDATLSRMPSSA